LAFIVLGVLRRMLFYLASFQLGRSAGEYGLRWLEARAGVLARFIELLKRVFDFAPRVAIVFLPGPGMSSIAGLSGMPTREFLGLTTLGLTLRMIAIVALGELWREPIEAILAWVEEYRFEGTLLLVAGVLSYHLWQRRARRLAVEAAALGGGAEAGRADEAAPRT
jgi:membrane protein DedA with SNARE-associated domain